MADLTYCSNIIISDDTQNLWQNIYSSQSYGTFYSVFSRFDLGEENTDGREIDSLELKMINYKGTLNMAFFQDVNEENEYCKGFVIKEVPFKDKNSKTGHDSFILLQLVTCARAGNPSSKSEIKIEKEDLEGIKIKKGQLLFIERILLSFDGHSQNFIESMPNDKVDDFYHAVMEDRGVFDDEFFYRNGFIRRKRQDTDSSLVEDEHDPINGLLSAELLDGNPSCRIAASYFRFN